MSEKNRFEYNYSASEQQEIKKLREKYIAPDKREVTIDDLRRLDERVTEKAILVSLISGIVGATLLGLAMSFIMSDLGRMFGNIILCYIVCIPMGLVGIVMMIAAYPL